MDDDSFAGNNNGMRRASQVFRGSDIYGEVELKPLNDEFENKAHDFVMNSYIN